jgi:GNAT superfamily N-acetyltransferase
MMPGYQGFPPQIFTRGNFLISTDVEKIDVDMVYHYLAYESYWAAGISRKTVERFLRYSLCYGVYEHAQARENQIGFARVISDFTTYAYLADLFILANYRGNGLGKWLVSCILAHDELKDLRKWTLNTRDAHGLYKRFGFRVSPNPETHMTYRPQSWRSTTGEIIDGAK